MERAKIGFITGLTAEARWLRNAGFMVRVGGGTPFGAEQAAEALVREGAQGLISFGLAGGLKPGLVAGSIIVPTAILEGNRVFPADYALMAFLGGSTGAPLYAGQKIAATAHDKSLIYCRSHPDGIDLESGAVARVAQAHSLPFAALRAVADPADADLPPAALMALTDDGKIKLLGVALSILRRPQQIKGLIALAQAAKAARAALLARLEKLPERTF
jgi:adenosylhomocysteine nucleosidase